MNRDIKRLHKETLKAIQKMAVEFDVEGEELPDNIQRRLGEILTSKDLQTATHFSTKAKDAYHVGLLARGKVAFNPNDPRSFYYLEQKIKAAEGLAKMLDDKGMDAQAQSQRIRAKELREKYKAAMKLNGCKHPRHDKNYACTSCGRTVK